MKPITPRALVVRLTILAILWPAALPVLLAVVIEILQEQKAEHEHE